MRVELELAARPRPPPRRATRSTTSAGGVRQRLRDVRLLVSELVTNAVRHANLVGQRHHPLVFEVADHALRVEVHDPGGGFVPTAPAPDPARPSGWGLYLVAELADRWGVDSDERTLVWFELDRRAAAA